MTKQGPRQVALGARIFAAVCITGCNAWAQSRLASIAARCDCRSHSTLPGACGAAGRFLLGDTISYKLFLFHDALCV